jgi:hypothetical protein
MMTTNELAAQVKSLKETVGKLEKRITVTEDIEAIKKLQRAYGYYLEHWEEENLTALWSHRDDITLEINAGGQYKGWEAIKKAFNFGDHYTAYGGVKKAPPEYLHILMPLNGIIDVEPDGINAKGRWYGFFLGALYRGGTLRALIGCGIWENEYIKEDGIWKFKKLFFNDIISSRWTRVGSKPRIWPIPRTALRRRPGRARIFSIIHQGTSSLTIIKIQSPGNNTWDLIFRY